MFILRKIVIGTFSNFVNSFVVLFPNQTKVKGTRTSFLTNLNEQIDLSFFPREPKNMHLLNLGRKSNLLFATSISVFANLSLKWQYGIYAFSCFKFITGFWPPKEFYKEYVAYKLPFGWLNFSNGSLLQHFFTSNFTNFFLLDSLLVGKGFLTDKVLNEIEFCIL